MTKLIVGLKKRKGGKAAFWAWRMCVLCFGEWEALLESNTGQLVSRSSSSFSASHSTTALMRFHFKLYQRQRFIYIIKCLISVNTCAVIWVWFSDTTFHIIHPHINKHELTSHFCHIKQIYFIESISTQHILQISSIDGTTINPQTINNQFRGLFFIVFIWRGWMWCFLQLPKR